MPLGGAVGCIDAKRGARGGIMAAAEAVRMEPRSGIQKCQQKLLNVNQ
jgi:hypothetical protein